MSDSTTHPVSECPHCALAREVGGEYATAYIVDENETQHTSLPTKGPRWGNDVATREINR